MFLTFTGITFGLIVQLHTMLRAQERGHPICAGWPALVLACHRQRNGLWHGMGMPAIGTSSSSPRKA
ncbi:MAG: hypothetical protein EA401_02595 [Planctomycetota bacterium]|nr:MAG: hypothetical protein EA401_02595 [Planctomycetota bacterium]